MSRKTGPSTARNAGSLDQLLRPNFWPKRKHADRGYLCHTQVAALAAKVERQAEAVRFLVYTGLRWGETAALRVQDLDMLRRRVNVSRSVTESGGLVWSTPKTHERRSVPFPAVLADELAALMVGKSRDELVFNDQRGGVLRNSNWRARVLEPAVTKCASGPTTRFRRSPRTTCGTPQRVWRCRPAPTSRRSSECSGTRSIDDA
jgi:integrase